MQRLLPLTSLLISSLRFCAGGPTPQLQFDPDTIASCVEWYDNTGEMGCEDTRDYYSITPEQFTEWNPSVSLACEPWNWQSYCIVTQERLDNSTTTTTTTTSKPTSTTSSVFLGPTPTSWTALGCYLDEDPEAPALEKLMGNDTALTIPDCQNECYLAAMRWAGVKGGDECWCSGFIDGDRAKNQTDCNLPCGGDKDEICGGEKRINIFEPVFDDGDDDAPVNPAPSSTPAGPITTTTVPPTDPTETPEKRNFGLF
ncbi:hypothetical protein FQN52_002058 [Onygenales sp. PD_12]|nr:hypothetical protein FQN52_002058 [Onygenales sp. PD_12]